MVDVFYFFAVPRIELQDSLGQSKSAGQSSIRADANPRTHHLFVDGTARTYPITCCGHSQT